MAEEDMLSRMTTNVSPTSTPTKVKKVKIKEAPMTQAPVQSKKSFCEKHPKVCKAGRTAGKGAAIAGMGILTTAVAADYAAEKAAQGIMWLGENTYPDEEPKTRSAPKKRTTASKPRKTATKKRTVKANNSASKRKTSSKGAGTRKKTTRKKTTSKRKSSSFRDPDYWRI